MLNISERKKTKKKVELLAPAGSLKKMQYALGYGADAVYCGVPNFSLRARINQFSNKELIAAVDFVRKKRKKIYITLNIYAHQRHLAEIRKHIFFLKKLGVDGIIVSDPGILSLIRANWPACEIHLSTQANTTNLEAVQFWKKQGIRRIILARETTLGDLKEIGAEAKNVELEYFVHGAMCMSYSGRCILSQWMTGRSANLGDCSQPCRWAYKRARPLPSELPELELIDDQGRFGMLVSEDAQGTYFFNSYDLNLIEHVGDLISAGAASLKIEGRAKSVYYVAVVTRAYRQVIDAVEKQVSSKELKKIVQQQKRELSKLAHRGYSTGFLLGREPEHNFDNKTQKGEAQFVGEVEGVKKGLNVLRVHNQLRIEDWLEAVLPEKNVPLKIEQLFDDKMQKVVEAHGGHARRYYVKFDRLLDEFDLVRKITQQTKQD